MTFTPTWRWGLLAAPLFLVAAVLLWPRHRVVPAVDPATLLKVDANTVTLPAGAPQWQYVQLAVAEPDAPLPPVPAPGRVDLDETRTSSIGAPLSGKVDAVQVRSGDVVKHGDRLFSVRSGAFADLNREVQSAREEVAVKTRLRDRVRELVRLQVSPEKEALAAEAELREAELAYRAAQAKQGSLEVGGAGENLFWIRAPRAGIVVDLDVSASQQVSPERDRPLLRISDLDEVRILADVQEVDAADLTAGRPATVRTPAGAERVCPIDRVAPLVDPLRRTVEVRLRCDNRDRFLRPNAFVEVLPQPDPSTRRVQVPAEAVVSDGGQSVVFVAEGSGKLVRRKVTPGRQRDGRVELREGLEPGARYVARGAILLLNQIELAE